MGFSLTLMGSMWPVVRRFSTVCEGVVSTFMWPIALVSVVVVYTSRCVCSNEMGDLGSSLIIILGASRPVNNVIMMVFGTLSRCQMAYHGRHHCHRHRIPCLHSPCLLEATLHSAENIYMPPAGLSTSRYPVGPVQDALPSAHAP